MPTCQLASTHRLEFVAIPSKVAHPRGVPDSHSQKTDQLPGLSGRLRPPDDAHGGWSGVRGGWSGARPGYAGSRGLQQPLPRGQSSDRQMRKGHQSFPPVRQLLVPNQPLHLPACLFDQHGFLSCLFHDPDCPSWSIFQVPKQSSCE